MRTKILFILGFLMVLAAGVGFIVLRSGPEPATKSQAIEEEKNQESERESIQEPEEIEHFTLLTKENFTLGLPLGWTEITQPNLWPIVIIDLQEEITDEKAKEIGFQTNLSIDRAKLEETLPEDYIENVKTGLIQSIPIIEIAKEEKTTINDRVAYFLEISSIQQDLYFKTLLVFMVDEENTIWALSFNTLKESWLNYKDTFYQIAQSFKFNQKMLK